MKVKLSLAASLLAATAMSFGYTTSTTNFVGITPDLLAVVDNTGTPIAPGNGSVAVGYFGSLTDAQIATADPAALLADFVQFGSAGTFGVAAAGPTPGLFSLETDASIPFPAGNAFTGQNIYTVVGENTVLNSSNFLAVWKSNTQFGVENDLGLGSANSNVFGAEGSLLSGNTFGAVNLGPLTTTGGIQLGAVPEPSSSLLFGLGGLALLLRRKR